LKVETYADCMHPLLDSKVHTTAWDAFGGMIAGISTRRAWAGHSGQRAARRDGQ
jgi:hypothetical protein